jgi:hypothetical protein
VVLSLYFACNKKLVLKRNSKGKPQGPSPASSAAADSLVQDDNA